jgi:hypothetical protein
MHHNYKQEDLEQSINIGYFGKHDSLEYLISYVEKNISYWNEIKKINVEEKSMGYYYVCILLARDGLQRVI